VLDRQLRDGVPAGQDAFFGYPDQQRADPAGLQCRMYRCLAERASLRTVRVVDFRLANWPAGRQAGGHVLRFS
jgi:hypothetical protein